MYEILCFGDSNTWGYNPATRERFPRDVRWTGVLQAALGKDFHVIEEGLNGRTTVWEDPVEGDKVGKRHLAPCLESQAPLDLVVLMLGTNDTKQRYSAPPTDIARGIGVLLDIIAASTAGQQGESAAGAPRGPGSAGKGHRARPDVRGRAGEIARACAAVRRGGKGARLPLLRRRVSGPLLGRGRRAPGSGRPSRAGGSAGARGEEDPQGLSAGRLSRAHVLRRRTSCGHPSTAVTRAPPRRCSTRSSSRPAPGT